MLRIVFRVMLLSFTASLLVSLGCAQSNEGTIGQVPEQRQVTGTEQGMITPGHTFEIWACNVPGEKTAISRLLETSPSPTGGTITNDDQSLADSGAGYVVLQHITINVGNQTPTATGTATGTATQTPSLTSTQSPVQTVEPTLSAPLTFGMPGSAVSAQSTAVGRQGTATGQTANPTQTPTWAQALMRESCGAEGTNLLNAFQSFWQAVFGVNPTETATTQSGQ